MDLGGLRGVMGYVPRIVTSPDSEWQYFSDENESHTYDITTFDGAKDGDTIDGFLFLRISFSDGSNPVPGAPRHYIIADYLAETNDTFEQTFDVDDEEKIVVTRVSDTEIKVSHEDDENGDAIVAHVELLA